MSRNLHRLLGVSEEILKTCNHVETNRRALKVSPVHPLLSELLETFEFPASLRCRLPHKVGRGLEDAATQCLRQSKERVQQVYESLVRRISSLEDVDNLTDAELANRLAASFAFQHRSLLDNVNAQLHGAADVLLRQAQQIDGSGNGFRQATISILEAAFARSRNPTPSELEALASLTTLTPIQIRTWYQNKRNRKPGKRAVSAQTPQNPKPTLDGRRVHSLPKRAQPAAHPNTLPSVPNQSNARATRPLPRRGTAYPPPESHTRTVHPPPHPAQPNPFDFSAFRQDDIPSDSSDNGRLGIPLPRNGSASSLSSSGLPSPPDSESSLESFLPNGGFATSHLTLPFHTASGDMDISTNAFLETCFQDTNWDATASNQSSGVDVGVEGQEWMFDWGESGPLREGEYVDILQGRVDHFFNSLSAPTTAATTTTSTTSTSTDSAGLTAPPETNIGTGGNDDVLEKLLPNLPPPLHIGNMDQMIQSIMDTLAASPSWSDTFPFSDGGISPGLPNPSTAPGPSRMLNEEIEGMELDFLNLFQIHEAAPVPTTAPISTTAHSVSVPEDSTTTISSAPTISTLVSSPAAVDGVKKDTGERRKSPTADDLIRELLPNTSEEDLAFLLDITSSSSAASCPTTSSGAPIEAAQTPLDSVSNGVATQETESAAPPPGSLASSPLTPLSPSGGPATSPPGSANTAIFEFPFPSSPTLQSGASTSDSESSSESDARDSGVEMSDKWPRWLVGINGFDCEGSEWGGVVTGA